MRQREGDRILTASDGWTTITFDRCGELLRSEQLAARLQKLEERPPQKTAFVIGGAEGLDQRILDASSQ